jgi:hypothetical protein
VSIFTSGNVATDKSVGAAHASERKGYFKRASNIIFYARQEVHSPIFTLVDKAFIEK